MIRKPANLEEAVLRELENSDIFPIVRVTQEYARIQGWTKETLNKAVTNATEKLQELDQLQQSFGFLSRIKAYNLESNTDKRKRKS